MTNELKTPSPSLLQTFGYFVWTRLRGLQRDWIDLVEIAGMDPTTVASLGRMHEPPNDMSLLDRRRLVDALAFQGWEQLLCVFVSWRDGNATMFRQDNAPGSIVVHLPPPNAQSCLVMVELAAPLVRALQALALARGTNLRDLIADTLAAQVGVRRRANDASTDEEEIGPRTTMQTGDRHRTRRLPLVAKARRAAVMELWDDLEAVRAERCATAGDTTVPLMAQVPLRLLLELDDIRRVARIAKLPPDDHAEYSDSAVVTAALRGFLVQLRRELREVIGEGRDDPQRKNRHHRRSAAEPDWSI